MVDIFSVWAGLTAHFIFSPGLDWWQLLLSVHGTRLRQYLQPSNSGHKYRPRPSVSNAAVSVATDRKFGQAAP